MRRARFSGGRRRSRPGVVDRDARQDRRQGRGEQQADLRLGARARARERARRGTARRGAGRAFGAARRRAKARRACRFHRVAQILAAEEPSSPRTSFPGLRDNSRSMSAIGKADLPGSKPETGSTEYDPAAYELLKAIDDPAALRKLDRRGLQRLAGELRTFILESVSQTGGHLSSNLGTVELTIALHHVFNTPYDRIVWDVGHQTYPHKILTGRREAMARLRMTGGISGFPRRSESKYDTFGTAHSSTSISAALGMAVSAKLKNEKRRCIAVIGDGAMSAGMAYEAMNNAGAMDVDLLVILNDNEMSISRPVGALTNYLARLLSGRIYSSARRASEHKLKRIGVWELARRAEEHMKGMVTPSTLFEEFGFHYLGPIDGHDLDALIPTLQNIRKLS